MLSGSRFDQFPGLNETIECARTAVLQAVESLGGQRRFPS